MRETDVLAIKNIISKTGLTIEDMKTGPTSVSVNNTQYTISVRNSKLIVRQGKTLLAKKYKFDLSEFT